VLVPSAGKPGRDQLLQQCYSIRVDVFHRGQGFSLYAEIDKLVFFSLKQLINPLKGCHCTYVFLSPSQFRLHSRALLAPPLAFSSFDRDHSGIPSFFFSRRRPRPALQTEPTCHPQRFPQARLFSRARARAPRVGHRQLAFARQADCHGVLPFTNPRQIVLCQVSATYFSHALLRPFGLCCLASFGHKPEVSIDVVYLFFIWADSNLVILPIFKGNEFIDDDAPFQKVIVHLPRQFLCSFGP